MLDRERARAALLLGARRDAEDALREIRTAMAAWLESARTHGDPIPKPRYRPAIYAAGRPAA